MGGFTNTVSTEGSHITAPAGLLSEAAVPYEQETAELIAGVPAWKDIFSLARDNPALVAEMLAFARYLLGKEEATAGERER